MKINEVASTQKIATSLSKMRKSNIGARMHNISELEYALENYGEDILRVYICPKCRHKNFDHSAEESCEKCGAPSQFTQ
jgi:rubrerythrin